ATRSRRGVPGDGADRAAALDALERFLHRGRTAGALEHGARPLATGDVENAPGQVLAANVDDDIGAQPVADRQPLVAGAGEDDALGPQRFAELNSEETDRPRTLDEHRLAREITAHEIDRP